MEGNISQEPGTAPDSAPATEERRIRLWRFAQSRGLGLSHIEALLFAESGGDLSLFRGLVAKGCPAALALRIVL